MCCVVIKRTHTGYSVPAHFGYIYGRNTTIRMTCIIIYTKGFVCVPNERLRDEFMFET